VELVAELVLLMRQGLLMLLLGLGLCGCTGLIFHPMDEHVRTPEQIGLAYRDVWFEAEDGVQLHGWFLPAEGERVGSILFLHGNAENVSTHLASVAWMPAEGFDVLLPDYRGYGRSEGEPTLAGVHLDVEAALGMLLSMPEVAPGRVAIFGQSLGGALAITALARSNRRDEVRALVVEGAPTSYRELAQEKLGGLWLTWALQWPLALTIDDDYRPIDDIGSLAPLPVLIIQGEADTIVPAHHARSLFEAAGKPKALWLIEGGGHIQALASADVRGALAEWLRAQLDGECTQCRAAAPASSSPRKSGSRVPGSIRCAQSTIGMSGRPFSARRPSARTGLMNSQTISPSGVTSRIRPPTDSEISVLPFASRSCAPRTSLSKGSSGVPA
jgi:uncharacterized protein